jgi:periplasmic divalent cation tolerance protein
VHPDDEQLIVVMVTTGSAENAEAIARALVSERIAACVNVLPGVRSTYRWEGKVAVDSEYLLVAKTVRGRFAALEARVKSLHTYELPEVIAFDAAAGSKAYLEWLCAAVSA